MSLLANHELLAQLRPDPSNPAPLYRQVWDRVAAAISAGRLPAGAALPSERRLAQALGVSRITMRKALHGLTRQGLVKSRHGAGTFVADQPQPISLLTGFSDDVRSRGMEPSDRGLSANIAAATPEESVALSLPPGALVARLRRLRLADGEPLAIENAVVPAALLDDPSAVDGSLYAHLRKRGRQPVRALQHLRATIADRETAELLEVPEASAILSILRVSYATDGTPVESTRTYFRGDRYDFVAELRVAHDARRATIIGRPDDLITDDRP